MDLASAILKKNLKRLNEHLDLYEFAVADTTDLCTGAIEQNWVKGLETLLAKCPISEDGLNHLFYVTFRKPVYWECLKLLLAHPLLDIQTVQEVYMSLVQGVTSCPAYQWHLEAEFPHMLSGWAQFLPPVQLEKGVVPPSIVRALELTGDKLPPSHLTSTLNMSKGKAQRYIAALLPYCDPLEMLRRAIHTGRYKWLIEYVCGELGYDPEALAVETRQVLYLLETHKPKSPPGPTIWEHLDGV